MLHTVLRTGHKSTVCQTSPASPRETCRGISLCLGSTDKQDGKWRRATIPLSYEASMRTMPAEKIAMQIGTPHRGLSDVSCARHRVYVSQRKSEVNTTEEVFYGGRPTTTTSNITNPDSSCPVTEPAPSGPRFAPVLDCYTGSERPGYTTVS